MDDIRSILTTIFAALVVIYCVMPLIMFSIIAYIVTRHLRHLTTPNVDQIAARYEEIRAAQPHLVREEILARIIRGQAVKAGEVGAITGLGGLMTLPITLPIDLLVSMRIQAATVQFMAEHYGHAEVSESELRIRRYLIMSGGTRLARSGNRVLMDFMLRFVGRSLAKFIPLLGAITGFAVNYALASASGSLAQQWYAGKRDELLGSRYADLLGAAAQQLDVRAIAAEEQARLETPDPDLRQ